MNAKIWSRTIEVALLTYATLMFGARAKVAAANNSLEHFESARSVPLFDFHNNLWVNLHQVLFHEALLRAGKSDRRLQSNVALAATGMSEKERAAWNDAVTFYANTFGTRQELFDDEMVRINNTLAQEPDDGSSLTSASLPAGVALTLRSIAPVYRKYWWPAHDASNRQWISSQAARVRELGPQIAAAMEKDLRQMWPTAPIRVDVCYYVAEIGHAYTTDSPPHTTFSSSGTQLQDLSGFETLFHEASHSFSDMMSNALFAECGAQKKHCGDLWHAILFYTPGVEVRRALPTDERAAFTPYAYKFGLYTRGDWPKYRAVLEKDWQQYLDGKIDFSAAIHSMVADLQ